MPEEIMTMYTLGMAGIGLSTPTVLQCSDTLPVLCVNNTFSSLLVRCPAGCPVNAQTVKLGRVLGGKQWYAGDSMVCSAMAHSNFTWDTTRPTVLSIVRWSSGN